MDLNTGFNEFPLFKTKLVKGYSYASVILENIKKKIFVLSAVFGI